MTQVGIYMASALPSDLWSSICCFLSVKRALFIASTTSKTLSRGVFSVDNQGFWEDIFLNSAEKDHLDFIRGKLQQDEKEYKMKFPFKISSSQSSLSWGSSSVSFTNAITLVRAGAKADFDRVVWRHACGLLLRDSIRLWGYMTSDALGFIDIDSLTDDDDDDDSQDLENPQPPADQAGRAGHKLKEHRSQHFQLSMECPSSLANLGKRTSRATFVVDGHAFQPMSTSHFENLAREVSSSFHHDDASSSEPNGVTLFCSNVGRFAYYSSDQKSSFLDDYTLLGRVLPALFSDKAAKFSFDSEKKKVSLSMCQFEDGKYWDLVAAVNDPSLSTSIGHSTELRLLGPTVDSKTGENSGLAEQPVTSWKNLRHYLQQCVERRSFSWGDYDPWNYSLLISIKIQDLAGEVSPGGADRKKMRQQNKKEEAARFVKVFLLGRMASVPQGADSYTRNRATTLNTNFNCFKSCIRAIADPKHPMIPWRNFPLGKVLGPMFSGTNTFLGKTKMFVVTACDGQTERDLEALRIQDQLRQANQNF